MSKMRIAIIGGGHLGRIHAKLAQANEQFEVVAVVDPSPHARSLVSEQLGVPVEADLNAVVGKIDAAIIASPTVAHYDVATTLLRAGVHCLVEKPLATTPDQASRLVQIAKSHNRVLQTGHVERFNPCWTAVQTHLGAPKFIESVRSGPYSGRSTDIGVVMDLMIHDLDLILSLDRSPVQSVSGSGIALLGSQEDLAEARIEFESGCVANLRASRVASGPTRQMQIFATNGYANIDFSGSQVQLTRPSLEVLERAISLDEMPAEERMDAKNRILVDFLQTKTLEAPQRNAILDEHNDFAISIQTGCSPAVSGEDGARAVALATAVLDAIANRGWDGITSRPWRIGAQATAQPRILSMPNRASQTGTDQPQRRRAG